MNQQRILAMAFVLAACGGVLVAPEQNGSGDGGSGGGTTGSGGGTAGTGGGSTTGGLDGLNCDVATLLTAKCTSCHGASPSGGAPYSLTSRAQLLEAAPGFPGQTKADRSLARMTAQSMPPGGGNSTAELAVLQMWVSGGTPTGACGSIDAGLAPTTCLGTTKWTGGNTESHDMNPGLACKACHATMAPDKDFQFMGTVYRALHEQDTCDAQPPAGLSVDIITADGGGFSIPVRRGSGNFMSESMPVLPTPYRARVRDSAGKSVMMTTPQTSGDCNACHTEQGANGAAGRIVGP